MINNDVKRHNLGSRTVAETIREITRKHLEEDNGLLLGQAISAVGWVNGTVPATKGIIELPMTDVAGAGFAVGAAMVGRRPIFVIRFQDFFMLNGSVLINYASKCKELHGQSAPVFIRAIAAEGLGVVHSGILHSIPMHFPGCKVMAPMTPIEYQNCWDIFMDNDIPMFVSEHRASYSNTEEFVDSKYMESNADITLFPISLPRLVINEAVNKLVKIGVRCNVIHIMNLKPFTISFSNRLALQRSGLGLVIDAGFEICGAARSIAYELNVATDVPVKAMGIKDKIVCLNVLYQNKAPDAVAIYEKVKQLVRAK